MDINNENLGKIPPHKEDAEKSVLGTILLQQDKYYVISGIISENDFYFLKHKEIYISIKNLERKGEPIDLLTVGNELSKREVLDKIGGNDYLRELVTSEFFVYNVESYAKMIREAADLRRVIKVAGEIIEQGYSPEAEPASVVEFAESKIFEVSQKKNSVGLQALKDVLLQNIEIINTRSKNKGKLAGVPSGYYDLDEMTGGFQKGEMVVLAARPSMGKTAFALNVSRNAALEGKKIIIFSAEMPATQLGERLLTISSKIDSKKLKKGNLNSEDWGKLSVAVEENSTSAVYIDDTSAITISDIKNVCRKKKMTEGLDLVVIDYLQLLNSESNNSSRTEDTTIISKGAKQIAREMDCPVIILSQLTRGTEHRTNHRPMLADLRDSGAIEQDADKVLFLYRDWVYDKEKPEEICEVIVAKNRNGPIGTAYIRWDSESTKFDNLEMGYIPTPDVSFE